ncbi:MAG TPA: TRAP transporter small permease subunit, partial [Vicinamibacteria bacterium]|nr:TRAP transporter small permease subunit [Vicinamibacteria bacterium]
MTGPSPLRRVEQAVLVAALAFATLLPMVEALGRYGGFHVSGSALYVQQLTLWLAFVGGLFTTGERKHLTLSTTEFLGEGRLRDVTRLLTGSVAAAVAAVLAYAAGMLVAANREEAKSLPIGVPTWISEAVMPVTLGLMAVRFALQAGGRWRERLAPVLAIAAVFALGRAPELAARWVWPLSLVLLAAVVLGAPIFVGMGGLALLLFFKDG